MYLFGIQHSERHFGDFSVLFHHLANQSVGDRPFRIRAGIRSLQVGIVPFYLLLGNTVIEVDGGVIAENLHTVLEAGANIIVMGSAVFNGDPAANTARFKEEIARFSS